MRGTAGRVNDDDHAAGNRGLSDEPGALSMTQLSTTQLGRTGIDVYPVALGGSSFGWTSDEATSRRVLDAFTAGGGDFIDTADSYMAGVPGNCGGQSETIIGSWLAARKNRDRVIIGTKVSQHPRFKGLCAANVAAAAEASHAAD
jgi:aryl-alcohol dehydrogenase-like predicted oxidoreductase